MIREFSNRVDRLRKAMERERLDALLLMNPRNIFYISGHLPITERLHTALLIPHSGELCMILPEIELERSKESWLVKNVRPYDRHSPSADTAVKGQLGLEGFMSEVQSMIQNCNLSNSIIGMEFSYISVSTFETLRRRLDKTGIKDVSRLLLETRSVKDYEEIETLRDSLEISEKGIRTAIELIQPGITEIEVAAEVERIMRKSGSKRTGFDSVIASGLGSAQELVSARQKRIDTGELVAINVSAVRNEYYSDVARTIYTGKPGEKHKRLFELTKKALSKMVEQITPGITSSEIIGAVRHFLKTLSLGDTTLEISGNGIGLEVCEYPWIFNDEVHLIKPGMVICVRVVSSVREIGGIRIGETILVTDEGKETLNKLPIDTI